MRRDTRLRGISSVLILGVPVTLPQLWLSSPVAIWRISDYLKKVTRGIGVVPALSKLELAWKNHCWMLGESEGNPCDFYVTLEQTKISAWPVWGICFPWQMIQLLISSAPENCICNSSDAAWEFFSEKHSETSFIQSICCKLDVCICVYTHTVYLCAEKWKVPSTQWKQQEPVWLSDIIKKKKKILSLHLQSLWDCQCYLQGITWNFL